MAEATGQAETQPALQGLNQAEAVAAIAAEIQKNEEQPRDDVGKFAKPVEAKPETEAPKEEAPQPEEPEAEIQPEPRRFKLKYNGEELEKDETEVIELAQKGHDYTQKSQRLAKEREELAAKVKADTAAAIKQYEDRLAVYEQAVMKMADPEVVGADLNKMANDDPAKALQTMLKRQQLHQTLQGIAHEKARLAQERDVEMQTARQKEAHEALEVIQREVPGWNNDLYAKILKTAVESGATQEKANAITEPWMVKVLNEARQFRELQAAKPKTVDKRIAAVPKVTKPGTSERPDPASKLKDSMAALSKTGSRTDAQALVLELMNAGRL